MDRKKIGMGTSSDVNRVDLWRGELSWEVKRVEEIKEKFNFLLNLLQ